MSEIEKKVKDGLGQDIVPGALDQAWECVMCPLVATYAVVYDKGAAFIPCCSAHLDESTGFIEHALRYGKPDGVLDLLVTKSETLRKPNTFGTILSKREQDDLAKALDVTPDVPIESRDGDDWEE